MRYTKIALLIFGAGLVVGLVVVTAALDRFDRVASGLMAVGIAAIPVGVILDLRGATKTAKRPQKKRANAPARRGAAPPPAKRPPRSRKPAAPKR